MGLISQNHTIILENLIMLPIEIRKLLFVVLPWTYGGSENYKELVLNTARSMKIPFMMITEFLNNDKLAFLRCASDILLNIQDTDAYSATIAEYLYAQNLLILGSRISYPEYIENDIYYISTSYQELPTVIERSIRNLEEEKTKCAQNSEKIHNLLNWNASMTNWLLSYELALKSI